MSESNYRRPGAPTVTATTPRTATMLGLLGAGAIRGGVALSRDEFAAIQRMYGFIEERDANHKVARFTQAGADRNALRHAEADGLRLVAWLARYVPRGEDPLKTLIQFAAEAGCDVDPDDYEWATAESCDASTEHWTTEMARAAGDD